MNVWVPTSPLSLYHSPLLSFNVYCIVRTLSGPICERESTCNLRREILYRHKTYRERLS